MAAQAPIAQQDRAPDLNTIRATVAVDFAATKLTRNASTDGSSIIEQLAFVLLPAIASLHLYLVLRDKRVYAQFKQRVETEQRQKFLRRWFFESLFFYGLIPLACLIALGHTHSLYTFPAFLTPWADALARQLHSDGGGFFHGMITTLAAMIVPLLLFGLTLVSLGRVYSQHKNNDTNPKHPQAEQRNLECLFPRNRPERFWTTLLSISAGVTEELCFRLVVPLMIFIVTENAILAMVLATAWFGLLHIYQGWAGVLATSFVGAMLMFVYVLTQNLWLVMLIHAIIDLNDLSFAPWFAEWLEKRRQKTA